MFSEDIYDLNKLEKFCLEKYENISFISPDIKKLKNLLEFHLSYNPVSELPDEMNDLKTQNLILIFIIDFLIMTFNGDFIHILQQIHTVVNVELRQFL